MCISPIHGRAAPRVHHGRATRGPKLSLIHLRIRGRTASNIPASDRWQRLVCRYAAPVHVRRRKNCRQHGWPGQGRSHGGSACTAAGSAVCGRRGPHAASRQRSPYYARCCGNHGGTGTTRGTAADACPHASGPGAGRDGRPCRGAAPNARRSSTSAVGSEPCRLILCGAGRTRACGGVHRKEGVGRREAGTHRTRQGLRSRLQSSRAQDGLQRRLPLQQVEEGRRMMLSAATRRRNMTVMQDTGSCTIEAGAARARREDPCSRASSPLW